MFHAFSFANVFRHKRVCRSHLPEWRQLYRFSELISMRLSGWIFWNSMWNQLVFYHTLTISREGAANFFRHCFCQPTTEDVSSQKRVFVHFPRRRWLHEQSMLEWWNLLGSSEWIPMWLQWHWIWRNSLSNKFASSPEIGQIFWLSPNSIMLLPEDDEPCLKNTARCHVG